LFPSNSLSVESELEITAFLRESAIVNPRRAEKVSDGVEVKNDGVDGVFVYTGIH